MTLSSRAKEYTWAVIISLIGSPTIILMMCTVCAQDWNRFISTSGFSALMWMVMWVGNSELTHFINKWISWVKFPVKRLVVGLVSTVLFTVTIAFVLFKLWEVMVGIKINVYWSFILPSLIITFLISFFLHGREFLLQWKQSAVEAERYQKESLAATYESLKSQVNPHFLFNSLNVLSNLVYEDQDKAASFINKLAEVYRYVLDTRVRELVSLTEELAFAESYIYLQRIRFGENLRVNLKVDSEKGKVIPLALQMLMENAIKHNEVTAEHPLEINITVNDQYLTVGNKIQLKKILPNETSGVGLENIKKRYEFLTSLPVEFGKQGDMFAVKIPVLQVN